MFINHHSLPTINQSPLTSVLCCSIFFAKINDVVKQGMAAYAALASLRYIMEQIHLYHLRIPTFTEDEQMHLLSLHKQVSFLQDFLETYSQEGTDEARGLESRIVDAAYVAEDVIESYVVSDIMGTKPQKKNNIKVKIRGLVGSIIRTKSSTFSRFSDDLKKVMGYMDAIVGEIKDEKRVVKDPQREEVEQSSSVKLLNTVKDDVVGVDDISIEVMDKLTGQQSSLQVVAITGMGGIGKSTLAKKVYDNRFTQDHFHVLGWATVTQEFNVKEILFGLLSDFQALGQSDLLEYDQFGELLYKDRFEAKGRLKDFEVKNLGVALHKYLFGRKYLITLDGIWDQEPWERIKVFLPNNNNGSRCMITTRLSNLANDIGSSCVYRMSLLNESESLSLLHRKVFLQKSCPPNLQDIAKQIVKNCNGLPLSIIVLGGLLSKSMKQEYWEYIARDTSTIINSDDGDRCLKILSLSYNHLPIHLKPCFLYLGIFPEDHEIRISRLIRLWVAEGFLKPNKAKSLEEVAHDNVKDLIDRNLLLVTRFGSTGNVKFCKIHDSLRDLCLREARNQMFLNVPKVHNAHIPSGKNSHRRIAIHHTLSNKAYSSQVHQCLLSSSFLRSFIGNDHKLRSALNTFKLLRVCCKVRTESAVSIAELYNSRYLEFSWKSITPKLPSLHLFWNLQTVSFQEEWHEKVATTILVPSELWEMSQLRHLLIKYLRLPDPVGGAVGTQDSNALLENLQTLGDIIDFRCTDVVVEKIPNVRKIKSWYQEVKLLSDYCLHNLGRLRKLESLDCQAPVGSDDQFFQNLELPQSLKSLSLTLCVFNWEDMGKKIGSLPYLEKLKLRQCKGGEEWSSVEGQFLRLKVLNIWMSDLARWTAENTHFPCLERLLLCDMFELEAIPSEIGDISTLRSIELDRCCSSATASAVRILEEQRSQENQDIHLHI